MLSDDIDSIITTERLRLTLYAVSTYVFTSRRCSPRSATATLAAVLTLSLASVIIETQRESVSRAKLLH
jgi:hypothetical protein